MAGNRSLHMLPKAALEFLVALPPKTRVLLRRGNKSSPGWFENVVATLCVELWMPCEWVVPDPLGDAGATFDRDVEMVRHSDCVMAFFAGEEMTGGTAHVIEKAQDQRVPAYAYGLRDGHFVRIGEFDPDEAWAELAPKL